MAKLLLLLDGVVLRHTSLNKERTTIGRRQANDLVIDNLGVSGEHAVISRRGEDYYLEDLNSTNGTIVNGEPITKHILQFGDSIEIGKYELRFVADSASGANGDVADADMPTSPGLQLGLAPSTVPARPSDRPAMAASSQRARLRILFGAKAGRELELKRALTKLGRTGYQVVVVTRRPTGYFISHVEGDVFPTVNGRDIGSAAHILKNGDLIEVAGVTMEFVDSAQ